MTLAHDESVVTGASGCDYSARSVEEIDDHLQALAIAAATARPRHERLARRYLADADMLLDARLRLAEEEIWAGLK